MTQFTQHVLMVAPRNFRSNEQTALNNFYQKNIKNSSEFSLQEIALNEFNGLVNTMKDKGIKVSIFDSPDHLDTPDAHFPNNWVSFHQDGTVILYPMFAENRRLERRPAVIEQLKLEGFLIKNTIDYSTFEAKNLFLEGTGSMILDAANQKSYCAISDRTHQSLIKHFCKAQNYTPITFTANQTVNGERKAIYHTNVMMCIGHQFSVICLSAIDSIIERENIKSNLAEDGYEIIEISENQVTEFAGNMIQLHGQDNQPYLVMSSSAFNSLSNDQVNQLKRHTEIIHSPLNTIEQLGGGSARCMIAEIFLPQVV